MTGSEILRRVMKIRKCSADTLASELGISGTAVRKQTYGEKGSMSVDWLVEALYAMGCEVVVRPFEGLVGDMKTEYILTPGSQARTKRYNAVKTQLENLGATEEYIAEEMNKRLGEMDKMKKQADMAKRKALAVNRVGDDPVVTEEQPKVPESPALPTEDEDY